MTRVLSTSCSELRIVLVRSQDQLDVDGSRDRGFELRQDRLYALDGIDDVCTRLPAKDDHNCGLAVG